MQIAINTACYIGRETGYALRPFAWGPARGATTAAYAGPGSAERLDDLASTIRGIGASAIEVWSAHLGPAASPSMVEQARSILDGHGLRVVAYAASLRRPGLVAAELERTFAIAAALGAPVIAGGLHPAYAPAVHALCRRHGIHYAIENHPEHEPMEMLAQLDGWEDWFGTTLDTGWYRTHGADVLAAIAVLRPHLLHVHLKDIKAVGLPHRTCALGQGIIDIPAVLAALRGSGYDGALSIEHEPPHHDPTDDLRLSYERTAAWLAAAPLAAGRA